MLIQVKFTKREIELMLYLAAEEAERLAGVREKDLIYPHKRVIREKENEFLTIVRKLLTSKESI